MASLSINEELGLAAVEQRASERAVDRPPKLRPRARSAARRVQFDEKSEVAELSIQRTSQLDWREQHPRWKVALAGGPEHVQSRARDAPHQVHDRVVESSIKTEGEELHAQERRQIDASQRYQQRQTSVASARNLGTGFQVVDHAATLLNHNAVVLAQDSSKMGILVKKEERERAAFARRLISPARVPSTGDFAQGNTATEQPRRGRARSPCRWNERNFTQDPQLHAPFATMRNDTPQLTPRQRRQQASRQRARDQHPTNPILLANEPDMRALQQHHHQHQNLYHGNAIGANMIAGGRPSSPVRPVSPGRGRGAMPPLSPARGDGVVSPGRGRGAMRPMSPARPRNPITHEE
jgi:hypothetical protein